MKLSARRSSDWEQLGFQGENPATDFRAMGLLGLSNLIAFADVCGLDAGRLLQESRDGGLRWFSYAITGINLTADLVKLTRERALDEYYFRHGASPQSFHALYCQHTAAHSCSRSTWLPPLLRSPFSSLRCAHPPR